MNKLIWKLIAIVDIIGLIYVAPMGWKMADDRVILQVILIAAYAIIIWAVGNITIYAFTKES